jgi:ParB family chromosome partitioning protein
MNSATDKQRKALGKGLSALLPNRGAATPPPAPTTAAEVPKAAPDRLPIASIQPNPMQPRSIFHGEKLEELAESIRANGIIQPLIVRPQGNEYQIVAGERRWRAAQLAGLTDVPVVVQEISDSHLLEVALVENIQREDLNPIETAQAFERLHRELGLSQEEIGKRTGKDRSSIVNTMRLLKLPKEVQNLVAAQRLSMGHAKAILSLHTHDQQIEVAEKTAAQGMSVRQVEALVQDLTSDREGKPKKGKDPKRIDPNVQAAIDELTRALGTRVRIVQLSDKHGRIEIEYFSQEELDRLYEQLVKN